MRVVFVQLYNNIALPASMTGVPASVTVLIIY